jgi:hypothetical protein
LSEGVRTDIKGGHVDVSEGLGDIDRTLTWRSAYWFLEALHQRGWHCTAWHDHRHHWDGDFGITEENSVLARSGCIMTSESLMTTRGSANGVYALYLVYLHQKARRNIECNANISQNYTILPR